VKDSIMKNMKKWLSYFKVTQLKNVNFVNPFYIFGSVLVLVMLFYSFGWSYLYPALPLGLLMFFLFVLMSCVIIGKIFDKNLRLTFEDVKVFGHLENVTALVILGYIISAIHHGGFPLISALRGTYNDYASFGIPTFHVILVTFNSAFATYLFHVVLSMRKEERKKVLLLLILNLLPSLLIVNRGMLILILLNMFFIFIIRIKGKMKKKSALTLLVLGLLGSYLFGLFGNFRLHNSYQRNYATTDSSLFLYIGGATDSFRQFPVPDAFFWTYIYATSPLANLANTINYSSEISLSSANFSSLIVNTILPDFISKRINNFIIFQAGYLIPITPELNVATAFLQPYLIFGWLGMIIYVIVLFSFAYVYAFFLKKLDSSFYLVGMATMCTLFLMSFFANMLTFSGLSFQLVYPIAAGLVLKYKHKITWRLKKQQ